jgi:hypothetical protein
MKEQVQSGVLTVAGENEATIHLEKEPIKVEVEFKEHHPHPCSPHHNTLRWEIHEHERHHRTPHGWFLQIWWSVSDIQEIIWRVEFRG